MNYVHLCLSDLLDQDITANEYFQTLSPEIQRAMQNSDITTFDELQEQANRLKEKNLDSSDRPNNLWH